MGYTHYWHQFRPFTAEEWATITAEAKRICAKAAKGLYAGKEDAESNANCTIENCAWPFRTGFKESYAWRTFAHPDIAIPTQGQPIKLAGGMGDGTPEIDDDHIWLNGVDPDESYETFDLQRHPQPNEWETAEEQRKNGIFACCKTEYRPYDAVVVSILHVARTVAPEAITVSSDGGPDAIKLMF